MQFSVSFKIEVKQMIAFESHIVKLQTEHTPNLVTSGVYIARIT